MAGALGAVAGGGVTGAGFAIGAGAEVAAGGLGLPESNTAGALEDSS